MDEIQDLPLVILLLYLICTFYNGQMNQDVATRDDQQTRDKFVTYVSLEDESSSRKGLQIYDYKLPFRVFGLASPNVSTDGSIEEPTHEEGTIVIQTIQCLFCL